MLAIIALVAPLSLSAQQRVDDRSSTRRTLSLDEAIDAALHRGEEVQIAEAGVRAAEGGIAVATSGMLPQIAASANYTRTLKSQYSMSTNAPDTSQISKALSSLFSSFPFGKENVWTLGLTASQSIFTGGRLSAQREAAQARKRSADIDLTAAEAQVMLNVTQSYYDAELSDTLVQISQDALKQAEEVYKQVQLAYEVGEKAEFDALRAKVARDNQIPILLQSQSDRAQAYYRLKQLLNFSLDDSLVLTTPVVDSLARFASRSDTAEDARAPVRQAMENITASDAQIRIAEAARWPQITASSSYSPVAYPNQFFPNNNDWLSNWTAGVTLSLPLYTGGNIGGNIDQARATRDQASGRLEQAREAAAMDARSSIDALHTSEANLRSTASTASEAARAYEIAHLRYTQGISTQLELDDARLQEEQSRANWARAVRNYQVARAKLALLKDLPVSPAQAAAPLQGAVMQQSSPSLQSSAGPSASSAMGGSASPTGQ
ncbi:MAG: TolC family protein [Bacteroidota bacterium]|nr:TolC family protein [Bacteroidota bacterium]